MNIFNNRNVLLNVITQSRLRKWTPVFKMKMALLFLSALFLDKNYHKKNCSSRNYQLFSLQATLLTHINLFISLVPTDVYL